MCEKMVFLRNNTGSTLITALMILAILTLIILSLSDTTTTEVRIATNDMNYKSAFYNSDSGISVSSKFLEAFYIKDFEGGDLPANQISEYDSDFEEIILSEGLERGFNFQVSEDKNFSVGVKLKYNDRGHLAGSEKSFQFLYDFSSNGEGPGKSSASIKTGYRHIEHF